jgi:hypothetical protein
MDSWIKNYYDEKIGDKICTMVAEHRGAEHSVPIFANKIQCSAVISGSAANGANYLPYRMLSKELDFQER